MIDSRRQIVVKAARGFASGGFSIRGGRPPWRPVRIGCLAPSRRRRIIAGETIFSGGRRRDKLYAPLFAEQKEPYPNVKGVRDIAYGSDPLNKLDVFTSGAGSGKPVVIYVHGGGFERGDKRQPNSPFYDNLMLWLTQQGMVGVNMNYRLAPKST